MCTGKTLMRKNRSDRNFCSATMASKLRLVAAIRRAFVRRVFELPSLSNSRSCSTRAQEHTSELQSRFDLVCRLVLEEKNRRPLILPPYLPLQSPRRALSTPPLQRYLC